MEIRGRSTAFSACVSAIFAGAETWDWVSEAQCCYTLKFRIGEVEGVVLGGCAVDGTVASATCGEEACLLVFGEVEPNCFGLQVRKYVCETALQGLDFMVQGLLKVQKRSRCLSCTSMSEGTDPDVGGVKVL